MKIIWNGHSCFTVETTDGTLVLDPYADGSVPGFGPLRLKADRVLCSHGHSDHGAVSCVTLSGRPCTIEVGEIHTWHDNVQGKKRGANTIYVMSAEGMKISHLGDLGCALTEEQTALLSGLDALMIPVGGFYTIGPETAWELARKIEPRILVPMHYRGEGFGYDVIAPVEEFLALAEHVQRLDTNVLEPDKLAAPVTAVLRCPVES